jgi:hypothetical protein
VSTFLCRLGDKDKSLLIAVGTFFSFTMTADFLCVYFFFLFHSRISLRKGEQGRLKNICNPADFVCENQGLHPLGMSNNPNE